jgi:hypothetical protein
MSFLSHVVYGRRSPCARYEGVWGSGDAPPLIFYVGTRLGCELCSCVTLNTESSLNPWSRVLLEKVLVPQLVNKFLAFYGTRRFITAVTRVRHLSLL